MVATFSSRRFCLVGTLPRLSRAGRFLSGRFEIHPSHFAVGETFSHHPGTDEYSVVAKLSSASITPSLLNNQLRSQSSTVPDCCLCNVSMNTCQGIIESSIVLLLVFSLNEFFGRELLNALSNNSTNRCACHNVYKSWRAVW